MTWDDLLARGDDTSGVEERMDRITPDLPATFLYTSGTTGNPKGVVLTHHNVMFEAVSTLDNAGLEGPQRTISYLPLAHIAERVLATYSPPFLGSHVHAIPDPAGLLGALGEVHPTAFFGVPRVWEKIKTGISAKLAEDPDPANQELVKNAMAAGLAWTQAHEYGNEMTPEVEEAYAKADEAILGFLRLLLGLDQVEWAASAAAPMPLEVAKFMGGLGLRVYDVYGMTETTGAFTSNGPEHFKLGTVGVPNPGIEVRLDEDGEILCRGPVNTPGYHLQEQATRALIDEDGWIHTGDIGTVDEDGFYSDHRPQEGADHHLRGQEHRALQHRELPQGVADRRPRDGARRRPVLRRRDPHPRRRDRAAGGREDGRRVHRPRRPLDQAADPGDGAGGGRRGQRAALPARAGQGVGAAPRRVDRGVRGADPDAEAQAAGREDEVRRRGGLPLHVRPFDLQAHRGGAGLWPENTLEAFGRALALGVSTLELDVHLTAEDDVVVAHDAALADARLIRRLTRADLPPTMPLLRQVAALLRERGADPVRINLEIKYDALDAAQLTTREAFVAKVVEALRDRRTGRAHQHPVLRLGRAHPGRARRSRRWSATCSSRRST